MELGIGVYNLHCLINSGNLKRGDNILVAAMGAGMGAGFVALRY